MSRAVADAVKWRRSSFCEGGACAEVAFKAGAVAIRNSGDALGPVLRFDRRAWREFVARVKNGDAGTPR